MTKTHITFIHGIGNKPPVDQLRRVWIEALAEEHNNFKGFDPNGTKLSPFFIGS